MGTLSKRAVERMRKLALALFVASLPLAANCVEAGTQKTAKAFPARGTAAAPRKAKRKRAVSAPQRAVAAAEAQQAAVFLPPQELRQRAATRVFQLITRRDGASEKRSYGSAFVIDRNGTLATNFHVVSDFLFGGGGMKLELIVGQQALPASVADFDVTNDLALIRVPQKFDTAYALIDSPSLQPGQRIFSIGLPRDTVMTMVDGLFSDLKWHGPLRRYYSSAPVNQGMSGGPVVDEMDRVIGVNSAIMSTAQNVSILIPFAELKALASKPARDPASRTSVSEEIAAQLAATMQPWLERWRTNSQPATGNSFGAFSIRQAPENSQCWEDQLGSSPIRTCTAGLGVSAGPNARAGEITLAYTIATPTTSLKNIVFEEQNKRFVAAADLDGHDGKFACHERIVHNRTGLRLLAHYCTSQQQRAPKLLNLELTFRTLGSATPTLHGYMSAIGIPRAQLLSASEAFLDGVAVPATLPAPAIPAQSVPASENSR